MKPFTKRPNKTNGFTLTEALVAAVTTMVVAGGAAVGMRGLNSAIRESSDLSGLRSNATTGTRLLRSEVQRSLHLMVQGGTHAAQREYTDLNNPDHPEYKTALNTCAALEPNSVFNPFFGMKMAELDTPVIYGLGVAKNGMNYAVIRCGPPLRLMVATKPKLPSAQPCWKGLARSPATAKRNAAMAPLINKGCNSALPKLLLA